VKKKPLFLDLDSKAKQDFLSNIQCNDLSVEQVSVNCEALRFLEDVERQLKSPNITLKKIRELFAFKVELLKKIHPA